MRWEDIVRFDENDQEHLQALRERCLHGGSSAYAFWNRQGWDMTEASVAQAAEIFAVNMLACEERFPDREAIFAVPGWSEYGRKWVQSMQQWWREGVQQASRSSQCAATALIALTSGGMDGSWRVWVYRCQRRGRCVYTGMEAVARKLFLNLLLVLDANRLEGLELYDGHLQLQGFLYHARLRAELYASGTEAAQGIQHLPLPDRPDADGGTWTEVLEDPLDVSVLIEAQIAAILESKGRA
jgi:hypothetical protein